jgi:hypothetical protein
MACDREQSMCAGVGVRSFGGAPSSAKFCSKGMGSMGRLIFVAVVALSAVAFAEDPKAGGKSGNARVQVMNFEDDTIEGDLTRPDGEYIEATKKVKHSPLIKIREEFKDKVMQSVDEL